MLEHTTKSCSTYYLLFCAEWLIDKPDSKMQPIIEEVLPEKYNEQTELGIDVQPGSNQYDYALESMP